MDGNGRLGDNSTTDRPVPTVVSGSHNFTHISANNAHTCGVRTDGTALCWGKCCKAQGLAMCKGHAATPLAPLAIALPHNWVCPLPQVMVCCPAMTCHEAMAHIAALTGGGGLPGRLDGCAGDNSEMHLGDNSTTARSVPTVVSGSHNFTTISAGTYHTCALRTDGTALCWGK